MKKISQDNPWGRQITIGLPSCPGATAVWSFGHWSGVPWRPWPTSGISFGRKLGHPVAWLVVARIGIGVEIRLDQRKAQR